MIANRWAASNAAIFLLTWAAIPTMAEHELPKTPPGSMKLLPGYTYRAMQGIDSFPGEITKKGGMTITHDIGRMAGRQAEAIPKENLSWYKEQTCNGHTLAIAMVKDHQIIATFPDDCANFFAKAATEEDVADFLLMVTTYKCYTPASVGKRRREEEERRSRYVAPVTR